MVTVPYITYVISEKVAHAMSVIQFSLSYAGSMGETYFLLAFIVNHTGDTIVQIYSKDKTESSSRLQMEQ